MKFLIILLSIALANKSCKDSNINQDKMVLEYSASSRSAFKKIIVKKQNISIQNKREGQPIIKTLKENNWNSIIETLKNIDIENINVLEPPSKKHQFDGAAISRLKITYNDTIYQTQGFDDDNPPKPIAELIKEIISISQNIE